VCVSDTLTLLCALVRVCVLIYGEAYPTCMYACVTSSTITCVCDIVCM